MLPIRHPDCFSEPLLEGLVVGSSIHLAMKVSLGLVVESDSVSVEGGDAQVVGVFDVVEEVGSK